MDGKLQPFPTLSILLDNITAKGKQAQSALEAKPPPKKNYTGNRQQSYQKTTDFWAAVLHLNYGT